MRENIQKTERATERERQRETERDRERQREKEREREKREREKSWVRPPDWNMLKYCIHAVLCHCL